MTINTYKEFLKSCQTWSEYECLRKMVANTDGVHIWLYTYKDEKFWKNI